MAVGVVMILGSLVAQLAFVVVVVGLLWAGVQGYLGLDGRWWVWVVQGAALVMINALSFYEFRRMPAEHRALGIGGAFFCCRGGSIGSCMAGRLIVRSRMPGRGFRWLVRLTR